MGALLGLAILFFILWILGWVVFHVASFAIHILLLIAIVLVVMHLFGAGRKAAG